MSASCIFCSLIRKPNASLIQEDEHLCIYPDIAPQAPHHFLIIPPFCISGYKMILMSYVFFAFFNLCI